MSSKPNPPLFASEFPYTLHPQLRVPSPSISPLPFPSVQLATTSNNSVCLSLRGCRVPHGVHVWPPTRTRLLILKRCAPVASHTTAPPLVFSSFRAVPVSPPTRLRILKRCARVASHTTAPQAPDPGRAGPRESDQPNVWRPWFGCFGCSRLSGPGQYKV